MGTLSMLAANCPPQFAQWLRYWSCQSENDIFSHPEFVKLFCRPQDEALCAYMEMPGETLLFPFILRPLSAETWAGMKCEYYDVISPYGYGGMVCSNKDKNGTVKPDAENAKVFWHEFDEWAFRHKVVSCFVRFSPYAWNINAFSGEIEEKTIHISRSLNENLTEIWQDFDHKVRTNIRRAERNGLKVEVDVCGKRIAEFKKIYFATMERHHALPQYYFPEAFFSAIIDKLAGNYVFFHTLHENKVISTELVLVSKEHMYSFLGGTDKDALKLYPNEIIKYSAIVWGIEHGKKTYELGGGYNGLDNLFRYKKSFAPQGDIPLVVGKKIYDEEAYGELCALRSKYEIQKRNAMLVADGFFPLYRNSAVSLISRDSGVQDDEAEK